MLQQNEGRGEIEETKREIGKSGLIRGRRNKLEHF